GATTIFAVRVAGKDNTGQTNAKPASTNLKSASGTSAVLTANSPGTWGGDLSVNVAASPDPAVVEDKPQKGGAPLTLEHKPILKSARNRISVLFNSGVTTTLKILYDDVADAPKVGEVKITRKSGKLEFGDTLTADDQVFAAYLVDPALANP